jgi:hypothetical protein
MVRTMQATPIIHQNQHFLQKDRNEILHNPRHLGVPSGVSKSVSEAMVHLVETVDLSCSDTNTVSKQTETSFHLSLVTQEYHPVHQKQFLSLWYVWHKPCTYTAPKLTLSPKDRNKILHDSRHLGVPSGASKSVLEAMERLVQTVDLSCIDNYTISKRTETRSYMTHITYEFHRVRPK